jgi:hypothetical protein
MSEYNLQYSIFFSLESQLKLTKGHWVTITTAIIAVILTGLVHVGIREWYQPDVRYEEGNWYRSSKLNVASLRLQNIGHSDAEGIVITASFKESLSDITTSDPSIVLKVTAGGVGSNFVTGNIDRIVPDETVYVYFAIDKSSPLLSQDQNPFISSIKFKGGQGKTGKHSFIYFALGLILGIVSSALGGLSVHLGVKRREELSKRRSQGD